MIARGTILMMLGQASFLLSAFAINIGLARLLGPVDYGNFGVVMSVLIVVELFVITGIPELIQKFGGENPEKMYLLKRRTLPWQIGYSIAVFGLFWFISPLIASGLGDQNLTPFIRIASFDIVFYGLFKFYQGLQNGLHQFEKHAILGITYSVSKVAAILGLVFSGFALNGALIGNMLGSVGGLIAGLLVTRLRKVDGQLDEIPYLKFTIPNILYFVGLFLFFCIDLWFVKIYQTETEVGYYVTAGALAKIPYVFSIALSAALLPSIAQATRSNNDEQVRESTRQSVRYMLMFLLLFGAIVVPASRAIIVTLFGAEYADAAPLLSLLIIGLSFVTIFAVLHTILQSRNRMIASFTVMTSLVIADVIANALLVPRMGAMGAALATTLVAFTGVTVTAVLVNNEIKSFIPSASTLKMAGIALVIVLLSILSPALNSLVILKSIGLSALYFALLWFIGEIKSTDLGRLKGVVKRA